jgi:hypothetical protein
VINASYAHRFHEVSAAVRAGIAGGTYPYGQPVASAQRNTADLPTGDPVIMLTSNNYLGLSVDAEVLAAASSISRRIAPRRVISTLRKGRTDLRFGRHPRPGGAARLCRSRAARRQRPGWVLRRPRSRARRLRSMG